MKLIVSTAVALLLAGQAFAGNLVFEAPEEPVVVADPAPMGGSNAAWIIPVIGLAAIAYAISNDSSDNNTPSRQQQQQLRPPRSRGELRRHLQIDWGIADRRCPFSSADSRKSGRRRQPPV